MASASKSGASGRANDPVVEAYKRDVDKTLLRENLRKTPHERVLALIALQKLAREARDAGKRLIGHDFESVFAALADGGVDFVIVGGLAATVHGSARLTHDLDVVYSRSRSNLERLATALAPYDPYLRGAPPGLPFVLDRETLERGLNFTLTTTLGPLDLLGEMLGAGRYEDVVTGSVEVRLFGRAVRVVGLDLLIAAKRAAGRPKDLEVIAELEALRDAPQE